MIEDEAIDQMNQQLSQDAEREVAILREQLNQKTVQCQQLSDAEKLLKNLVEQGLAQVDSNGNVSLAHGPNFIRNANVDMSDEFDN